MMHIEVVVTGAALRAHIRCFLAKRAKEFAANFAALTGRTDTTTTIRTICHFTLLLEGFPSFCYLKRARGKRSPATTRFIRIDLR